MLIRYRGIKKGKKKKGIKRKKKREKEQASDVESPPVVENLTLVGNLTVVENFQGLGLWKRPLEEISSLFLCRGRQSSHYETFCFPSTCIHFHPFTALDFLIYIINSDIQEYFQHPLSECQGWGCVWPLRGLSSSCF